jgi:ABC-type cobalamin/Fe3+-siderophores transport system ATPase subunit
VSEGDELVRIAVVGPCAAGKSTLVAALRARGYAARCVAQEHSYVPDMWRRISRPDILIYLDATLETIACRRRIGWGPAYLETLNHRLRHARANADIYLMTDGLLPDQVMAEALGFLKQADLG